MNRSAQWVSPRTISSLPLQPDAVATGTDETIQGCGGMLYALQWGRDESLAQLAQCGRVVQDGIAFGACPARGVRDTSLGMPARRRTSGSPRVSFNSGSRRARIGGPLRDLLRRRPIRGAVEKQSNLIIEFAGGMKIK